MSRFESKLLEAIDAEVSETKRSVLQLTWAAYRVRVGDPAKARDIAANIRARYSTNYSAQVFAYINFVEGLCEFFESGIESAIPKLMRSNALSNGCPADDDLPMLVKTWLAALYRILGNWKFMADFLILAACCCDRASDEASCRLCLVTADAFQEIESYRDAVRWYSAAHRYALSAGDDAALSAILYNRAAIRIFNSRLEEIRGDQVDTTEDRIALEAASARNYTQYINDMSMRWGFDLMAGQIHLLKHNYEQALALLDSERFCNFEHQWPAVDLVRRADVFRCGAILGRIGVDDLGPYADRVWLRSGVISGSGDKAVTAYSLSMGLKSSDDNHSLRFLKIAQKALEIFDDERRRESVELDRFIRSTDAQAKFTSPISSGSF